MGVMRAQVALLPASTQTITVTGSTSGETLLAFVTAPAVLTLDSGSSAAGWVQDASQVNSSGFYVYRLPGASNPGGTLSLVLSLSGPRSLAAVVIGGAYTATIQHSKFGNGGVEIGAGDTVAGSWTTGLHTFTPTADSESFAVFPACYLSLASTTDLTGYDHGYVEVADSGFASGASSATQNSRVWVASQIGTGAALSNAAVDATYNSDGAGLVGFTGVITYGVSGPSLDRAGSGSVSFSGHRAGEEAPASIFTTQVPTLNATDNTAYTLGTRFTPDKDGNVEGARFYLGGRGLDGQNVTLLLYSDAGAELARVVVPVTAATPLGWVSGHFATAVPVTAGSFYRVAYFTPSYYSALVGAFPVTNGHLSAPSAGGNGFLTAAGTPTFPSSASGNGASYFADVIYTTTADITTATGSFDTAGSGTAGFSGASIQQNTREGTASGTASFAGSPKLTGTFAASGLGTHGLFREQPPNRISTENAQTGTTPRSGWFDMPANQGAGDTAAMLFTDRLSYAPGDTVTFKHANAADTLTAQVFRLGWYGSDGARSVASGISLPGHTQPAPTVDATTGALSCANWTANGTWTVPAGAVPGVYCVIAKTSDGTKTAQYLFVVREPVNDPNRARILIKTSETTWAGAYNYYGGPGTEFTGKSLYGSGGPLGDATTRAKAASFDRVIVTRGGVPQTHFMNSELPFLRFMERNGYDVAWATSADIDADPSLLLDRDLVVCVGHDEYWSVGMLDAFAQAQAAGVPQLFLTGNECFWHIRFAADRRSFTCYKDSLDGHASDPNGYTGTWRDTRAFNTDRRPESLTTGTFYIANGVRNDTITINPADSAGPLWRDTDIAGVGGGLGAGSLGMEWDEFRAAEAPADAVPITHTTVDISGYKSDDNGDTYTGSGSATHSIVLHRGSGGAPVAGFGTTQWTWGLDDLHDRGAAIASMNAQQATANIIADLTGAKVGPVTPMAGLVNPTPQPMTAYGLGATGDLSTPSGSGAVVFSGSPIFTGTLAIGGSGAAELAGTPRVTGGLDMTATGAITDTGTPKVTSAFGAAGSGATTRAGSPTVAGALDLTGSGGAGITGTAIGGGLLVLDGTMDLAGDGTLTLSGSPIITGSLTSTGAAAVAMAGSPTITGSLSCAGAGMPLWLGPLPPVADVTITAEAIHTRSSILSGRLATRTAITGALRATKPGSSR